MRTAVQVAVHSSALLKLLWECGIFYKFLAKSVSLESRLWIIQIGKSFIIF